MLDPLPQYSRWLELATNRVIVIDWPQYPSWHYEDDHTRTQRSCNIEDFFLWNRFRRLS